MEPARHRPTLRRSGPTSTEARPESDQIWAELRPHNFRQLSHNSSIRNSPHLPPNRAKGLGRSTPPAKFLRTCSTASPASMSGEISARRPPNSVKLGRKVGKLGLIGPMLTGVGQHRSELGRARPIMGRIWPRWVACAQNSLRNPRGGHTRACVASGRTFSAAACPELLRDDRREPCCPLFRGSR